MTMFRPADAATSALLSLALAAVPPRTVIAIPARDEASRLPGCLAALAAQRGPGGSPADHAGTVVLVLANNCTDATAAVARALAPRLPFALQVEEHRLPAALAHAGGARRLAMATAAALFGGPSAGSWPASFPGALLCTDADARPAPGWLAANLAALAAGADAVAGAIALDPAEAALLPVRLRRREAAEARYAAALAALAATVDPDPHDPWPCHAMRSGASIGLTLAAYHRVGGVPAVAAGEDRALFAALARIDARIRHAPEARVLVSCRLDGRAGGSMAATLRARAADPSMSVDAALEPAAAAWARLRARRALRWLWCGEAAGPGPAATLAAALRVAPDRLAALAAGRHFGAAWEALEAASPVLRRRRALLPGQLAAETARVRAIIAAEGGWTGLRRRPRPHGPEAGLPAG